jgi:ketosteroid isomerase-like protein
MRQPPLFRLHRHAPGRDPRVRPAQRDQLTANVEIARRAIEAFNRADWDGFLADTAEGFELDLSRAAGPEHGVFGGEQARALIERFADNWESLRIEGDEFTEAGDHVVSPLTLHAVGRDGIDVPSRVTWVWTLSAGRIQRFTMYQELSDALEAVGLDS